MVLSFSLLLSSDLCSFWSEEVQPELRGECPGAEWWLQVKHCPLEQGTFLRGSLNFRVALTQQPLSQGDH